MSRRKSASALASAERNASVSTSIAPEAARVLSSEARVTSGPRAMPGEAEVKYLDGDFRVVRPGTFVRCAVTGVSIPLEELRYWSVDLQEAYATPEAVLQRIGSRYGRK